MPDLVFPPDRFRRIDNHDTQQYRSDRALANDTHRAENLTCFTFIRSSRRPFIADLEDSRQLLADIGKSARGCYNMGLSIDERLRSLCAGT
jgi:hypothetical protein